MKQTAVEWLVQEINKINVSTEARIFINKLEKQAKEIEKQQSTDTWNNSRKNKSDCSNWNCSGDEKTYDNFEQYYNEIFNK